MVPHVHGRCRPCKTIFRWRGWPRLRDAACPRCGLKLDRTAARLATRIPVVDQEPIGRGVAASIARIAERSFTLDGEPLEDVHGWAFENLIGLQSMTVEQLAVGEELELGGGAAATFTLRRTA